MLLPWFPDGLTIHGTALVRYALRALIEADAWSKIALKSLLHSEQELQKSMRRNQLYLAAPNHAPRFPWISEPGGELLMHPTAAMFRDFARNDLLKLAWHDLPLEAFSGTRLNHWFRDPGKTLKLAHWSIARTAGVHGLGEPSVSASLAIAGIGILGLQLNQRCEQCFRLAVPGLNRCGHHSQSSRVKDLDVNRRRASARAAARILELVGDLGPTKDIDLAKQRRAQQVHGAIFDCPIGDLGAWHLAVQDALSSSCKTKALLPSTVQAMSTVAAVQSLRACIDPYERDPNEWPTKICQAEEWFAAEIEVAPGRPPKGPRAATVERIRRYAELQAEGLSADEIARRLHSSPRALALMLKRAQFR